MSLGKVQMRWRPFSVVLAIGVALAIMLMIMMHRVATEGKSGGIDVLLTLLFSPAEAPLLYLRDRWQMPTLISGIILQVLVYAFLAGARFRFRWLAITFILLLHLACAAMLIYFTIGAAIS